MSLKVGDYWWFGNTCLQCTEVTVDGSHRTRELTRATADRLLSSRWTVWEWPCPECGKRCTHTGTQIPVRMVPLCTACIVGDCPPTLRDPGLPPDERTAP